MKAIRVEQFGLPEVMKLVDVPVPQPARDEVLVRVHAIGVNPVETYIRSGSYARKPSLPYTPGTDAAGTIESVGENVTAFKAGDRVYTSGSLSGTYAEFTLCATAQVHLLPPDITFSQGAALGIPYATAYRALFQRARARPAETVLVHGASGGVGIAAVQLACLHGLRVLGTAGTEAGKSLVSKLGASGVFDHHAPDCLAQIRAAAPEGVDVILEMLANVNLDHDLTLLARGGRVVVIGSRGRVEIDPREAMGREAEILGMVLFNTPAPDLVRIHAALYAGLQKGSLCPVLGAEFPIAEAAVAHEQLMKPGALGKITLTP